MPSTDEARRTIEVIEAAALGISGAALAQDMDYACQRHEELLAAARRLAGLDLPTLCLKAGRQLRACARGDKEAAQRLAHEIIRLISFCS